MQMMRRICCQTREQTTLEGWLEGKRSSGRKRHRMVDDIGNGSTICRDEEKSEGQRKVDGRVMRNLPLGLAVCVDKQLDWSSYLIDLPIVRLTLQLKELGINHARSSYSLWELIMERPRFEVRIYTEHHEPSALVTRLHKSTDQLPTCRVIERLMEVGITPEECIWISFQFYNVKQSLSVCIKSKGEQ